MAHFLTPSKIGLLALIELYTEATVPASATIPVLSFILAQLLPSTIRLQTLHSKSEWQDLPFALDLKSFQTLLSAHRSPSTIPERSLWQIFREKLWEIDSLDALHRFFETRSHMLAKTKEAQKKDGEMDGELGIPPPSPDMIILSRTSPLGTFIRRAKVEFDRLRFCDAIALWTSFARWRQESAMDDVLGRITQFNGDKVLVEGELDWGHEAAETLGLVAYGGIGISETEYGDISSNDIEKLLEFQVEQMQKLGSRISVDVRDRLKGVLESDVMTPSLSHYINFLDAWRSGDYPTSFDNLHRYFDYTMQNRDRLFYQYALMNMAVLQADFGCFEEAVAAMLETVSTARENKDMACLNFALNWLYHFGKSHPYIVEDTGPTKMLGVEREGLAFLRIKAKECSMWTLWSSALLSEAKMGMANGDSVATVFEDLVKSSNLITEKNMKNMLGPQTVMYASLWGRLGIEILSRQHCDVFLSSHLRSALFDDTLRLTCRVSHQLAERGFYDQAIDQLEALDRNALRSWKARQYWLKYRGILRLKRELHRNNLDGADQMLSQLLQSNDADSDLAFEINILHIDYLVRRVDYNAALAKTERMTTRTRQDGNDINLRIKLLTMKSLLQDKAGRPQKGFSVAVRAASIAWRARLIPALWGAMGAIANILTSLSEFQASSAILTSILPRALECENCSLNAQLYSFLVDSTMGLAGLSKADSQQRNQNLTRSICFLNRAFLEYSKLEDSKGQRMIAAKMIAVMSSLKENARAHDSANLYMKINRQAVLMED